MWSCCRRRPWIRLSAENKHTQVALQAIPSTIVGPLLPTPGLVTPTLGHGVRGSNRDVPLAAAAAAAVGQSVGGDAAEEL